MAPYPDNANETKPAPWADLFRDGRGVYTVSLSLGIALHAMDAFVVSTVMPTVVEDIGGAAFYAWVVMLYMTASIIGAASGGPVKLMFGARRGYVAAGLLFLVGTMISALAPVMPILLTGRVVQGFGVGMIVAQNVALISELFPGNMRVRMITVTSGVWAAAALVGPMIGGIFAEFDWWRGAFWFGVPIILFFTVSAWRALPDTRPEHVIPLSRFPIGRVVLLGVGVLAIGATGNIDALSARLAALTFGFILIWLTIRLDHTAENRIFPSRPFSLTGPVGTAYWIFLLLTMAPMTAGIYLPLAYQILHGLSPLAAGYLAALLAVAWSAAAVLTSMLHGGGVRVAVVGGPALTTIGLVGIALTVATGPILTIAAFTIVTGAGVGLCTSHLMNWTMSMAAPGEESITASSIQTMRSLGIAIGAAGAGLIANMAGLGSGVTAVTVSTAVSWVIGIFTLAPLCVVGLGFLLVWHRHRHLRTATHARPAAAPGK
jgi:MFS family permease